MALTEAIQELSRLQFENDCGAKNDLLPTSYGQLAGAPSPEMWPLDSFRSIDCMTIYGYALGQRLADGMDDEKLREYLPGVCRSAARNGAGWPEKLIEDKLCC